MGAKKRRFFGFLSKSNFLVTFDKIKKFLKGPKTTFYMPILSAFWPNHWVKGIFDSFCQKKRDQKSPYYVTFWHLLAWFLNHGQKVTKSGQKVKVRRLFFFDFFMVEKVKKCESAIEGLRLTFRSCHFWLVKSQKMT